MKEEFNLEHQYQLYLKRMGLNEKEMHPQQRVQLRQTFMGASGQILVLLRDELSKLSDEEAVATMQDLWQQVLRFFIAETNREN